MNQSFKKVSIIIVTYNNLNFTKECLTSIEKHSHYPSLEIIVIDNKSEDGTQAFLQNWKIKLWKNLSKIVILNKENSGFAKANNQGLKIATGEYLVLLNNDTYVTPYWIHKLIAHFKKDSSVGIIGPITNNIGNEAKIDITYTSMEEMLKFSNEYTKAHQGINFEIKNVAFFCVMLRKEVFKKVGLLDESFGLGFFEDDDYCRRIEKIGKRIVCAEDVYIHHHLSASFSKISQETRDKLFIRNKKIYEKKWGPWVPHHHRDKTYSINTTSSRISIFNKIKKNIIKIIPHPIYKILKRYILKALAAVFPSSSFKSKYLDFVRIEMNTKEFIFNKNKFKAKKGKKDIFLFPIIDWNFRFQRPQHCCQYFQKQGHRVFYISATFNSDEDKPFTIFKQVSERTFLVTLSCPSPQPVIYSDVLNEDQLEKVSESLKSLLSYLTARNSIFIINLPFWTDLVIKPEFDKHKIIYDCMDYHAGFNNSSANMEAKESLLIRYADAVIVSSKKLYDRFENTKNLKIIRNAGEFERFAINPSATKPNSSFPNIGYFGAISEWFDVDLVEFLAQKKRNWNFTLIGSYADAKISKLQKLPNIKLLNEIPYEELPLYLHSFDVCIIPFIISPLIEHTNPVKVYEYLSAGKPVVSTMLPELILLDKKLVYLAKTKFDFIKQLDRAMKERNKKALIKFRTEFARKNSWNIRMKQFYKLAIR